LAELEPLAQPRRAERGRPWSVLQTALRTVPQLFGRHDKSKGLAVSGLSPRGDGDAFGIKPNAHRQTGRLGAARRSARKRRTHEASQPT